MDNNYNTALMVKEDTKIKQIEEKNQTNETTSECTSSSDESESSGYESSFKVKAPIELIAEFITYIRSGKWERAQKLCKMILIYEPENGIAIQFKDLIEEKIQLDLEESDSDTTSDESSESFYASSTSEESDSEEKESSENDTNEYEKESIDTREHLSNRLHFPSTLRK